MSIPTRPLIRYSEGCKPDSSIFMARVLRRGSFIAMQTAVSAVKAVITLVGKDSEPTIDAAKAALAF